MLMFPKMSLRHASVVLAGSGGLVAGMILAVPGIASAGALTCGSTITTNTKLTANLNCTKYTSGPAITIGADDVTLNLNGHKILGPGDSAGTEGIADGSSTQAGYNFVTVENGSLSNFLYDVYFYGTSSSALLTGATVHKITTTDNSLQTSTSVFGEYLTGASISDLSSSDASYAVDLEDSEDSTVSGNQVNSPYNGLYDDGGAGNTFSGNTLTNVSDDALYLNGAAGDVVETNTFTASPAAVGIYDDDVTDVTITGNTFTDTGEPIGDIFGSDGEISDNTGTGSVFGIYTAYSSNYAISGNTFSKGDYGIETDYPDAEILTGNTTNDNIEVGVYVWTDNSTGYSAELKSNTGNDNRFGLYSQITTTGSKNHASGNKVVNCYNVKCVKAKGGRSLTAAPPHYAPPHLAFTPGVTPGRWGMR
jgi:parallel beta-helix repeat protein